MEVREPSAKYLIQRTDCDLPGWQDVKLGAVASFRTGPFGSALHKSDYVLGGVPVINPMQIEDGRIKPTDRMSVAEEAAERLGEFRLRSGDVVIGRRGEMGRCAFVQDAQDGWLCGTGSMIVRPGVLVDGRFLQRLLSSNQAVRAIESASVGTTMINLNQRTLAELGLQLPVSVDEQSSIARALTDADALIDSLEQLLTKKRQIKQGAMQELLTGQRRLPGFDRPWKETKLRQLGTFFKGSGIRRDEALSGDLPCVRYGEIYTTHSDHIRSFSSWISPVVAATSTVLRRGDLLFAGSGETKEEIGKCVAFLYNEPAYAGGDIVILRPTVEADSMFLGYLLNMPFVVRQKASRGQGDAVVHISANALGEIEVELPAVAEQTAIAQALSDMDTDISALESRLTKARALKQAMAQALLTGRIRLVPEGAV